MFDFLKIKKKSKSLKKHPNKENLKNNSIIEDAGTNTAKHDQSIQKTKLISSVELPKKYIPSPETSLMRDSVNSVLNSTAVTPRVARRDLMDLDISSFKLGRFVSEYSYEPRKPPSGRYPALKNNMYPRLASSIRASSTPAYRPTSNRSRDDPIYLAKFAGGYEPDPNQPKRIESLEWLFYDRISNHGFDNHRKRLDSYSSLIKPRSRSIDSNKFPGYHYIFDSECYDYISKFKRSSVKDSVSSGSKFGDDLYNQRVKHIQEKLHEEIEKISKYQNRSSMVADLLPEIKSYENGLSEKIDINPWKASRSRNADVEPASRTRYQSPFNASPSRVCRENCASSSGNSPCLKRLFGVSSYATSMNNGKNGFATSRSSLTECGSENVFHDEFDIETKRKVNLKNYSNSSLIGSYQASYKSANERNSTCKELIADLKPGYSLKKRCKQNGPKMTPCSIPLDYSRIRSKNLLQSIEKKSTPSLYKKISGSDSNIGYFEAKNQRNNRFYTYEALKVHPRKLYPKSIDRKNLEKHLSAQEFYSIFKMNKEQFYELSSWKQLELKKIAQLF